MAGGKFAAEVVCLVCLGDGKLTKATRVLEGYESDQYRCELGHDFGMDFPRGAPTEPQWPAPPELRAALEN